MTREATVEIAYVPFKTFLTALDTLRQGVPDPLDRSVFRNQSFSTQAMLISGFKALGCIDTGQHPQPILTRLVDPEQRRVALKEVLEERYGPVIALGMAASEKQFDDCFASYGVQGDTRKKAKSFFLQAAHMAGIKLSPHIPGARIATTGKPGGAARTVPRRRRKKHEEIDKPGTGGVPTTHGTTKVIQLTSGGKVTLSASVDVMTLSADDRRFVFDLIDRLSDYEKTESGAAES